MITYEEEQKLRFRIRQLEDAVTGLRKKLDFANNLLSKHKIGPYKYTDTKEDIWQKKVDLACSRIEWHGIFAAERIKRQFGDHEVYYHPLPDGRFLKLTGGVLFEEYKKKQHNKDKHDKNIHTGDGTASI